MKHLVMTGLVAALLMAGGAAQAEGWRGEALQLAQAGDAGALKKKPVKECADENTCNNRPEAPKTRGLKSKPVKECGADENSCNNRPEAPKTRGLKKKPVKEICEENSCANR